MAEVIAFDAAMRNAKTARFPRWFSKKTPDSEAMAHRRIAAGPVLPAVSSTLRYKLSDGLYAMGSCFAREIELALAATGANVLSTPDSKASPVRLRRGAYMNRYTPMSMLHDVEIAFGIRKHDPRSIVKASESEDLFLDLHAHPVRGLVDYHTTAARQRELDAIYARMHHADVMVFTLGLVEAWFDTETGEYINTTPTVKDIPTLYPGRFECHILSYEECAGALDRIYDTLKAHRTPMPHIVVTTSPVPLLATYSGRDVLVANTYSKSVLRACAESWTNKHPGEITYFPSYEMAMLSDPALVWMPDRAHVKPTFVKAIIDHFIASCVEVSEAQQAAQ